MYRHPSLRVSEASSISTRQCYPAFKGANHVTFQRIFQVSYLGYAVLDRRYTLSMLPWLVAEIKRHGSHNAEAISIEVTEKALKARSGTSESLVFEHKLQTISKFAQTSQDPCCFTYMTREVVTGPCAYHVFQATEENTVLELFTAIKERSKELLSQQQGDTMAKSASGVTLISVINSSQQYEVLYVGRIKVSGAKAPATFIDYAVEKFRTHEYERSLNTPTFYKRHRHGSSTSISSLPQSLEILENPGENPSENPPQQGLHISSKEDLSSSSGVSSSESQKSLDTNTQMICDTESVFQAISEDSYKFPSPSPSSVPHSRSMDIASACQMLMNDFKDSDSRNNLMPPSSNITRTQSLDAPACAQMLHDLKDTEPTVIIRDRVRSCSGDVPRIKQHSLPVFKEKESGAFSDTRRPRAYSSPSSSHHRHTNRTMLFLIGRSEICLIGTDKKQMVMSKTFNDISTCVKGVKYLDHFGFVCRETNISGTDCLYGYIFQCQTEKVVDELMQTLKNSFKRAEETYQKFSDKSSPVQNVFICDRCPMQWFHKLCSEVEGLSPEGTHLVILKRLGTLPDIDKERIILKFQNLCSDDVQEQNEILMMFIREFSEQKQLIHIHVGERNSEKSVAGVKEKSSKLDSFRQKARNTISSSFETFLKLTNRDDVKEQPVLSDNKSLPQNYKNTDLDAQKTICKIGLQFIPKGDELMSTDCDSRSYRKGSCDSTEYLSDTTSPLSTRPRSFTFSSTRETHLGSGRKSSLRQETLQSKRPIMNMFMRSDSLNKTPSPAQTESKGSWRQAIFHRVQTPGRGQTECNNEILNPNLTPKDDKAVPSKKSSEELRALWKKAIFEQILLIRMEKENRKLQANQDAVCHKRMKLNYEDITPCIKSASLEWEKTLNEPKEFDIPIDKTQLIEAVKKGVPRHKRGDIWQYLAEQNQKSWSNSTEDLDSNISYGELVKQLTSHQHAILIDIGRTFPNHPFYSQTLGPGQLSLFNLLKAYSLLDNEVGYCQGLSFVAGILLLHMPEEQAFSMIRYLMFDLGLRRQYKTDMVAFQIQMYQLSRLLHDNHRDLYEHLDKFDIATTLYAAPWFLTLFASQFPVGFVSRLFDLLFLFGMDVIFKVSLLLLGNFKDCILNCDSFESVMDFLKVSLPSIEVLDMQIIFSQVFSLDISRQLHSYEVEYHVLWEETAHLPTMKDCEELLQLQSSNKVLKAQNMELMEKLQLAYNRVDVLETSETNLKCQVRDLHARLRAVEEEKENLFYSYKKLQMMTTQGDSHHPPPLRVAYSGTEREEAGQFQTLKVQIRQIREEDFLLGSACGTRLQDDIQEEDVVLEEEDVVLQQEDVVLKEEDVVLKEEDVGLKEEDVGLKEEDAVLKDKDVLL